MADPNIQDFYGRLYRIRKTYSRGGGFEAAGTLGRAYFVPPRRRRSFLVLLIRPLLFLAVFVTLLKAVILSSIGATAYMDRLATLQNGDRISQAGEVIMKIDPATRYIADKIGQWTH